MMKYPRISMLRCVPYRFASVVSSGDSVAPQPALPPSLLLVSGRGPPPPRFYAKRVPPRGFYAVCEPIYKAHGSWQLQRSHPPHLVQ